MGSKKKNEGVGGEELLILLAPDTMSVVEDIGISNSCENGRNKEEVDEEDVESQLLLSSHPCPDNVVDHYINMMLLEVIGIAKLTFPILIARYLLFRVSMLLQRMLSWCD